MFYYACNRNHSNPTILLNSSQTYCIDVSLSPLLFKFFPSLTLGSWVGSWAIWHWFVKYLNSAPCQSNRTRVWASWVTIEDLSLTLPIYLAESSSSPNNGGLVELELDSTANLTTTRLVISIECYIGQ